MKEILVHHHLKEPIIETGSMDAFTTDHMYRMVQNIYVTAQKKLDAALTDACIRYCQETDCTDLYMIDGDELVRRLRIAHAWQQLKDDMRDATESWSGLGTYSPYRDVLERMEELEKTQEEETE